jgi:hypothetical protein
MNFRVSPKINNIFNEKKNTYVKTENKNKEINTLIEKLNLFDILLNNEPLNLK